MNTPECDTSRYAGLGTTALPVASLAAALPGGVTTLAMRQPQSWTVLLVVLAGAAAAIASEPLLRGLGLSRRPESHRWAVIAGGVATTGMVLLLRFAGSLWLGAAAFIGAFLGAAVVSWSQTGLLEENYPPAPLVRQAVRQAHIDRLRATPRRSPAKRAFDIFLAGLGLLIAAPLLIVLAGIIWFEQPGPVFFVKNSVGVKGRTFRQWKLRTMVHGAEDASGPVLAQEDDTRALRVGRWLRKTALDELPQLLNILIGDMSFVGPRPQRTVLVLEYLRSMPEYADRHQVRPGLAGLAQVAGDYYLTPRQKLRLDRLYVQHASLLFDLWLVTLAFGVVFWWRWRPDWRGHLTPAQIRGRRRVPRSAH